MSIGSNTPFIDKLIKNTSANEVTDDTSIINNKNNTSNKSSEKTLTEDSPRKNKTVTANKVKMTFYAKSELLEKLYNYAYWERLSVTEAFNIVLSDGLEGKNTDPKNK